MSKNKKRKLEDLRLFANYEKHGSKLTAFSLDMDEVSYVERILPEVIWLALLNQSLGLAGTLRVLEIMNAALPKNKDTPWFVFVTPISLMADGTKSEIKESFRRAGVLGPVVSGLAPFCAAYPEFPFQWLDVQPEFRSVFLKQFKEILAALIDKKSPESTLMLVAAVYGLGISRKISIQRDSVLADLEKVSDYPNTLQSKLIASGIRAMMYPMAKFALGEGPTQWSKYFWQHGFTLEPIDYGQILRGKGN